MRELARRIVPVGLALTLVFVFRVGFGASEELALAHAAFESGDREVAVDHYRRALRFHLPIACRGEEASGALFGIAATAAAEGNRTLALAALRSVRAGVLASRSFYVPHREALERANREIVRLVALEPRPAIEGARPPGDVEREHLALLDASPRGRTGWIFLTLLGLALLVGSASAFVTRAIDVEDRIVAKMARPIAGLFAFGVALFLIGLAYA